MLRMQASLLLMMQSDLMEQPERLRYLSMLSRAVCIGASYVIRAGCSMVYRALCWLCSRAAGQSRMRVITSSGGGLMQVGVLSRFSGGVA